MTLRRVPDIFRDCQLYLHHRLLSNAEKKPYDEASKVVRKWLSQRDDDGNFINGEDDGEGNRIYEFPRPVKIADGRMYSGVTLKRGEQKSYFDPDEVADFLRSKRIDPAKVIDYLPVVNEDVLYVLQQEGDITEDELRGLMIWTEPSYSLWPVEKVEELDE